MAFKLKKRAQTTTYAVPDPSDETELTGMEIHGHAFGSGPYRAAHAEVYGKPKKQSIFLEKDDERRMDLPAPSPEKEVELLAKLVTGVTGEVETDEGPWTYTPEAMQAMFANPEYDWIMEGWAKHLKRTKEEFEAAGKPRARTPKRSAG